MGTEKEIWKPIKGHEGFYSISNLGNIRNDKNQRILYGDTSGIGYRRVTLHKPERKRYFVHRLVASHFVEGYDPNFADELLVNHKNGIRLDNRAENLEWILRSEKEYPSRVKYSDDDEEYEIQPEEFYYQVFDYETGEVIKEYATQREFRNDYPMCRITFVTSCTRGWFYVDWQKKRQKIGIRKLKR